MVISFQSFLSQSEELKQPAAEPHRRPNCHFSDKLNFYGSSRNRVGRLFVTKHVQSHMGTGCERFESRKKTGMVFPWRDQQSEQDGCGIRMHSMGFRPTPTVRGVFGEPKARIVSLIRRSKKQPAAAAAKCRSGWYDRRVRQIRDLSCGDTRVYLEFEVRRVLCPSCGKVKRERLEFLANNPFYTKRFAYYVGRRCRSATIKDVAKELKLDWHTVKELDKQYMKAQLAKAGKPRPKVIGIDEVSIRKGHTYRIVVSDLEKNSTDLVRRRGPFRAKHEAILRRAGKAKERSDSLGGDGYVEAVSKCHRGVRAASCYSVRQVSCDGSFGQGVGSSAKKRIRAACGQRQTLYQGTEVHAVVALGEPQSRRTSNLEDVARRATSDSTPLTCSRSPLVSCGAMSAKAGQYASLRTGR